MMLFVLFFMIEQQGESQRGSRNAQVSYEKALGGNTPHSSIRGGRIDVDVSEESHVRPRCLRHGVLEDTGVSPFNVTLTVGASTMPRVVDGRI